MATTMPSAADMEEFYAVKSIKEIKSLLAERDVSTAGCIEREDLVRRAIESHGKNKVATSQAQRSSSSEAVPATAAAKGKGSSTASSLIKYGLLLQLFAVFAGYVVLPFWRDYMEPESSAQAVALARHLGHNIDGQDPAHSLDNMAGIFLNDFQKFAVEVTANRIIVLYYMQWRFPGSFPFLTVRSRYFDEALMRALRRADGSDPGKAIQQFIVLGAGFDTRAYRFRHLLKHNGVNNVIEVDRPHLQAQKRDALTRANVDTSHVTFVATDFAEGGLVGALKRGGVRFGVPTFVIWEGVTMYLSSDAIVDTLSSLRKTILVPGSTLVFDFVSKEALSDDNDEAGTFAPAAKYLAQRLGEPLQSGFTQDEVTDMLDDNDLTVDQFVDSDGMAEMLYGSTRFAADDLPSKIYNFCKAKML